MQNARFRQDFDSLEEVETFLEHFAQNLDVKNDLIKLQDHCTNMIAAGGHYI